MKRWGCLQESERLLLYTNPHLHWGHQHDDAARERAALAPCHWGQGQQGSRSRLAGAKEACGNIRDRLPLKLLDPDSVLLRRC